MIENFDYKGFALSLTEQAKELVPVDLKDNEKEYIVKTLSNHAMHAGEALYNDSSLNLTAEQATFITQIIAEWTFHKGVDLCRSNIPSKYWDAILQRIAFTIYEIYIQALEKNIDKESLCEIIEHHVNVANKEAVDTLLEKSCITESDAENYLSEPNVDKMANNENIEYDNENLLIKSKDKFILYSICIMTLISFVLGIVFSYFNLPILALKITLLSNTIVFISLCVLHKISLNKTNNCINTNISKSKYNIYAIGGIIELIFLLLTLFITSAFHISLPNFFDNKFFGIGITVSIYLIIMGYFIDKAETKNQVNAKMEELEKIRENLDRIFKTF